MVDIASLTDQEVIARTAWAEDRSGQTVGMQAIINSGQNRLASGITWWESRVASAADTLRSIFLHHAQYSCWNADDPNLPKLLAVTEDDPQYAIAMGLAASALAGTLADVTGGGDSYYAASMATPPRWSIGLTPTTQIGGQLFFKTV